MRDSQSKRKTGRRRRNVSLHWRLLCAALMLGVPSLLFAHRMLMDYTVEKDEILVEVFFPDGKPAVNVDVDIETSSGNVVLSGKTDAEGAYRFRPERYEALVIVAEGSLGHRSKTRIAPAELVSLFPGKETRIEPGPAVDSPVETRTVRPVAERSKIHTERPPIRDIFAGIGYIVGLFGIFFYIKAKREMKKKPCIRK